VHSQDQSAVSMLLATTVLDKQLRFTRDVHHSTTYREHCKRKHLHPLVPASGHSDFTSKNSNTSRVLRPSSCWICRKPKPPTHQHTHARTHSRKSTSRLSSRFRYGFCLRLCVCVGLCWVVLGAVPDSIGSASSSGS
jgi:hypothetical protein